MRNVFTTVKSVWTQRKHVIIFTAIMALYSLGGGGEKALRRFALPILIAVAVPLRHAWQRVLLAACLAVPLHFGYTGIVDADNWLMLAILGALMGASWAVAAKLRLGVIIPLLAILFPCSVLLSNAGLNWQWCELLVGFGYAVSYLICVNNREVWDEPSRDDTV
jgi:hypothetical protein